MRIIRECATGIEFLHSLGVVHCDIKPRNVLLTDGNQVRERQRECVRENA